MDTLCEYITETIIGYCTQKNISKEYKYQIRANNTQGSIAIDAYVFSHPYHDSIISIMNDAINGIGEQLID